MSFLPPTIVFCNGPVTGPLGALLPPLESLLSTQGIMVVLLVAYAGAMWVFLTSSPKVYTVMVSDLEVARQFYEGLLQLGAAEVPLHYYNYEQSLGAASFDPLYTPPATSLLGIPSGQVGRSEQGLWYRLRKNVQIHVIGGARLGDRQQQRHVCFDRDCLEQLLLQVQSRRLRYKVRRRKPLNFLVKDLDDRTIELAEIAS